MINGIKYLVTGGCSFSFVHPKYRHVTWPVMLEEYMSCKESSVHTALPSQGNGMISRKIIHALTQVLQKNVPKEIFVAVMWSGPNRHEFFFDDGSPDLPFEAQQNESWQNPTTFVENSRGKWYLVNHHWTAPFSKTYYRHFHDRVGAYILSLENILRVQWFLKHHGISYFMTSFTKETFPQDLAKHPDCQHLYQCIDFDAWLPISGAYEWARDKSEIAFDDTDCYHLNSAQNLKFFNDIIKPFLEEKSCLNQS